ncbi:hypothetical protein Bhyg_00400, partial [Pseudolycoriella hygida]
VYEKAYDTFTEWCNKKKITVVDQGVLMVYFSSAKMESYKPSTAWCIYSKLKSMLELNDGVDISKFKKLQMLLKRKSTGYRPKKSRILTLEDIYRFLKEAPDNNFLAVKVAMIVGVFGACRRMELVDMSVDDIEYIEDIILCINSKSTGYRPKKSRILTLEDIYRFLKEAPDNNFLAVKVAMIVGVFGACRRMELVDMSVDDIEYIEGGIKIRVPKTKTKKIREFVLREGSEDVLEEKSSLVIQF